VPTDSHTESAALRTALRELVALSTIPAAWVGREPPTIADGLADVLVESLQLDFAFVRLCDPKGGRAVEVMRGFPWTGFPEWLQTRRGVVGQFSSTELITDIGAAEACRVVVIPVGINAEAGLVAGACSRAEFPTEIDRLLLSVAANHAAAAFQSARLRHELDAKVAELGEARNQLEVKVAERTSDLQRSEAFLAEGQRLSHTGSWAFDANGFEYWSAELFEIHGLEPGGRAPTTPEYLALVHPEDREFVAQEIERMQANRGRFDFIKRIVRPDGAIRYVRCVGAPATKGHGFVGTEVDVTEHEQLTQELRKSIEDAKAAKDKLAEQEKELRQVLDLAPQLVAVLGPNLERLYTNSGALAYFGTTLEGWRQRNVESEVHPDDVGRVRAAAERGLLARSAYEMEKRIRGSDGTYRWFLARYKPVCDHQGQASRWYVACTDIEDRKRTEDRLQEENVALREEIDKTSMFEEIVGTSRALAAVLSRVSRVAGSDSTVFITGETGTGKELVARAIHRRSARSSKAFVAVNCAAIPRELIASELFGHEKGAFTGALQRRLGRFELANGGTIFLDEVAELSSDMQAALLRVLQERELERVGGRETIHVDVRVIAATNRDLLDAVASGTFREDLFYRLNVFPLEMPSLRERKQDIPVLVEYFIHRYARKVNKTFRRVNKRTLDRLQSYPWPGNVRELQNVIERSAIVCDTDEFTVDESWLSTERKVDGAGALSSKRSAYEKAIIEEALRASGGRVFGPAGAAARLRIPRSTLESRIRALRINKSRFRPQPTKGHR
jgi:PAS domain S-box-containing protein